MPEKKKNLRFSNLEPHQLEIAKDLDTKYEEISKELESRKLTTFEELSNYAIFLDRMLSVYNVLFNKYIMNDDFFLFRIEHILNYKLGDKMV